MARGLFLAIVALLAAAAASARAQTTPNTLTLTMNGPTAATSGQDVTYHLQYSFAGQAFDTGIRMAIPCHTTLLSERLTTGSPIIEGRDADEIYWFGFSQQMAGEFEINLRIDADFVGTLHLSAYVPPGFGGETQSNVLETEVSGSGTPSSDTCVAPPVPTPGPADPTCGLPGEPGESAVVGRLATNHGSVTIPELSLTAPITSTGCYQFRHLELPRSPMLISVSIESEGYRPLMWANYFVLSTGSVAEFNPPVRPGSIPDVFDACPGLLAHPQLQSAALQLQASLCAQLFGAPGATDTASVSPNSTSAPDANVSLPSTGMGNAHHQGHGLLMLAIAGIAFGGAVMLAALISRRTAD